MKYSLDLISDLTNKFWEENCKPPNVLHASPKFYRWLCDTFLEQFSKYGEASGFQEEMGNPWAFKLSGMDIIEDTRLKDNQISLGRVQTFEIDEKEEEVQ